MHSLSATALLLLALVFAVDRPAPLMAESEFYPGLRKPPAALSSWNTNNQNDNAILMAQLTSLIEDQTRRRFKENQRQIQHAQQILRQQQAEEYQQNRLHHLAHYPPNGDLFHQSSLPLPTSQQQHHQFHRQYNGDSAASDSAQQSSSSSSSSNSNIEPIPFAFGPDDPRFYETSVDEADIAKIVYTTDDGDNDGDDSTGEVDRDDDNSERSGDVSRGSAFLDEYEEMLAEASSSALKSDSAPATVRKSDELSAISHVDGVPSYKLKAPMEIKPAIAGAAAVALPTPKVREDISSLVRKLQTNGQADAIINTHVDGDAGYLRHQHLQLHEGDVVRTHVDMNAVVDMYVVAIIAGISATVTVGLVAIGIGWYTLHKKSMAAADVEYPAYGVTGPNKDISPSGDRRLAQSAQMYHYQHQKQQIIAMENRTHNEHRNGSMTDAESDEENEEGDYTVYECPGLAPTGEMEVKNPLFLDDPTPATPANNVTGTAQHGSNSTTAKKPANSDENTNVKKTSK